MNHYNKKYNLNEGRVIRTNNINYGGFPKIINEVAAPTPSVITAQNPMNNNVAVGPAQGGPVQGEPVGTPPGILPPGRVPPYNTPEFDRWFIEWQLANTPRQFDGESREDYHIRRRAYDNLWFQITWWIGQYRSNY
jgi:hypothetical protein